MTWKLLIQQIDSFAYLWGYRPNAPEASIAVMAATNSETQTNTIKFSKTYLAMATPNSANSNSQTEDPPMTTGSFMNLSTPRVPKDKPADRSINGPLEYFIVFPKLPPEIPIRFEEM